MTNAAEFEEALFSAALLLPPAGRGAFVQRACGGDAALCRRLEILLRTADRSGGALDSPPEPAVEELSRALEPNAPPVEKPGVRVGRYRLLQQIGEGGFGVVWMAEQEEPIRRRVALKISKLGLDTRSFTARFEAERQALALMDHPNIARVFDAGATDTGRPFFVMELVRGTPITRYCDENNLGTTARVQLFVQVCHAVHHAHQKGIIHRDLKPSNILVTLSDGEPIPKVIDFGIAKATQGRLTDRTLFTAFEQFIGTPAYVSPEQTELSGADIDTRSDVYSLGVLLYELLTGRTPFESQDLLRVGLDRMRQIICEHEPPKPSTRVSTFDAATRANVGRQRAVDAAKLPALLRGDLDWIVMRCLEKNRVRRYESADGLARDLQRHLANEPVLARPPRTAYVLRRFARRHRFGVLAGGAVLASLVVGLVFTGAALLRERAARERADTEAVRSEQVARFLENMLSGVGPEVALGRDPKLLRTILDETVERMKTDLRGQPDVEADLRAVLGNVYRDLGEFPKAVLMHQIALHLRRELHGEDDAEVAESWHQLGEALGCQGRLPEAEVALRRALALREKLLGPGHASVAGTRAALMHVLRLGAGARSLDGGTESLPAEGLAARDTGAGESAGPSVQITPDGLPLLIRLANAGGRAGANLYNGGDVFSTAHQRGALETEFSTEGIRIEWTYLPGGRVMDEALSRKVVDFANQGVAAAIVNRASGLRRKVLLRTGVGAGTGDLVVRADSPFQTVADLRGKRIGTVLGTGGHLALCRALEQSGLSRNEVEFVNLESTAAVRTALSSGEVDAQPLGRPYNLAPQVPVRVVRGGGRDLARPGAKVFSVSEDFERRHPAIVQRVVTAMVKTAAWCSDDGNREAVFAIGEKSGLTRAELERNWADAQPLQEHYSPLLDEYFFAELRRSVEDAKRFEMTSGDIDMEGWVESKYLIRALDELGLQGFWSERDASGNVK